MGLLDRLRARRKQRRDQPFPDRLSDAEVLHRYGKAALPKHRVWHGQHVEVQEMTGAYVATAGNSPLLTVGADFGDEIYSHPAVGLLNASKAGRIAKSQERKSGEAIALEQVPLSGQAIRLARVGEARSTYFDPKHVEETDQPIMFLETKPGALHIFGGSGKIAKLDPDDPPVVDAYVFQPSEIEQVRVSTYARKGSGWVRLPDEGVAKEMMV